MPTPQEVWAMLQAHEGETFYTAKGLPFHYLIHGRELFVNRKNKSITISTVANALARIKALGCKTGLSVKPHTSVQALEAAGEAITGPKKIGCYGASYLYPVFLQLGIIHLPQANDEPLQ